MDRVPAWVWLLLSVPQMGGAIMAVSWLATSGITPPAADLRATWEENCWVSLLLVFTELGLFGVCLGLARRRWRRTRQGVASEGANPPRECTAHVP